MLGTSKTSSLLLWSGRSCCDLDTLTATSSGTARRRGGVGAVREREVIQRSLTDGRTSARPRDKLRRGRESGDNGWKLNRRSLGIGRPSGSSAGTGDIAGID